MAILPLAQYTPLLTPSPAFAFYLLGSGYTGRLLLQDFHHSILVTAGLSLSFLALASLAVVRVCRERPACLGTRWMNFRNRWSYGRPACLRCSCWPLLDRNAFFWLAGRDRAKRWYAWFFTTTVILMWCCAGWQLEGFMFDWDASFWLLLVIFL